MLKIRHNPEANVLCECSHRPSPIEPFSCCDHYSSIIRINLRHFNTKCRLIYDHVFRLQFQHVRINEGWILYAVKINFDRELVQQVIFVHAEIVHAQFTDFDFITVEWVIVTESEIESLIIHVIQECVVGLRLWHVWDQLSRNQFRSIESIQFKFGFVNQDSFWKDVQVSYFILFSHSYRNLSGVSAIVNQI